MKGVLFFAAFVAAVFTLGGRALAVIEYCPADSHMLPLGFANADKELPAPVTAILSAPTP